MKKIYEIRRIDEAAAIDEEGKMTEESGIPQGRKKPKKRRGKAISAESNSGETSDRANQMIQLTSTSIESQAAPHFLNSSNMVFCVQLSQCDIEEDMLTFLAEEEVAKNFLLALFPHKNKKASHVNIVILDHEKLDWMVTLNTNNPRGHIFTITGGWKDIVEWHFLESMDVICFYKPPDQQTQNVKFFIDYLKGDKAWTLNRKNRKFKVCKLLKGEEAGTSNRNPEFEECNLLLEHRLNSADIEFGRFRVTKEEVSNHFPVLVTSSEGAEYRRQRLKFTDAQNRDWFMEVRFCKDCDQYMFVPCDQNEGLVREYNLRPLDVIRFYRSAGPSHKRHFRIGYVKLEEARAQHCRFITIALLVAITVIILIIFGIAFWTTQKWTSK